MPPKIISLEGDDVFTNYLERLLHEGVQDAAEEAQQQYRSSSNAPSCILASDADLEQSARYKAWSASHDGICENCRLLDLVLSGEDIDVRLSSGENEEETRHKISEGQLKAFESSGAIDCVMCLGSYKSLSEKKDCKTCLEIASNFKRYGEVTSSDSKLFLHRYGSGKKAEYLIEPSSSRRSRYLTENAKREEQQVRIWPNQAGLLRKDLDLLMNSKEVDIGVIRQQILECEKEHKFCKSPPVSAAIPKLVNLHLIDLQNLCIVTLPANTQYAALSYVWGGAPVTKHLKANSQGLRQHKALAIETTQFQLPTTIRDAMTLSRKLGEQYLWVDTLCIIQDDTDELNKHLAAMCSIYSNAHFTIVAAHAEHSNVGILGVDPSRPRNVSLPFVDLPSGSYIFSPVALRPEYPQSSRWATRGWTYQESLFSRRLLIMNRLTSWLCRGKRWREEGTAVTYSQSAIHAPGHFNTVAGATLGLMDNIPQWPKLNFARQLVSAFHTRSLTFEIDAAHAFKGIEAVLGAAFPGGFLWGLPEFYFDIAMLWQPLANSKRRESDDEGKQLPSWSWMGWDGLLEFSAWQDGDAHYGFVGSETRGCDRTLVLLGSVDWFKYDLDDQDGGMVPIKISHVGLELDHPEQRADSDGPLPEGWSREDAEDPDDISARGKYLRHKDVPRQRFRHPMPLVNIPYSPRPDYDYMIYAKPSSADFFVTGLEDTRVGGPQGYPAVVVSLAATKDSKPVGALRVQPVARDEVQVGVAVQLIAISEAGIVDNSTSRRGILSEKDWKLEEWYRNAGIEHDGGLFLVTNVLWIEWDAVQTSLARRKALGRIIQPVWKVTATKETLVALG